MRRPRRTIEELRKIHHQIEQERLLDERRRRLYNRKYRKSGFFIGLCTGRILYIILFFSVALLHNVPKGQAEEIVLHKSTERYLRSTKNRTYRHTELSFITNYSEYTSTFIDSSPPEFNISDTLVIERNTFGKPIYFMKKGWYYKYPIDTHLLIHFIVVFMTLISFFFNDGYDKFTNKVLLFTLALDVATALCYFVF